MAARAVAFGVLHEVGVAEVHAEVWIVLVRLLPLDHAVGIVAQYDDDEIELQPHLPNFMIDPMRLFGKASRQPRYHFGEVSVVRPNRFSVFGKLIISERAVAMIVREELLKDKAWAAVTRILVKNMENPERGLVLKLDVTVRYGVNIPGSVRAAQDRIKMQVEYMTWMTVTDVDIFVRSIVSKV